MAYKQSNNKCLYYDTVALNTICTKDQSRYLQNIITQIIMCINYNTCLFGTNSVNPDLSNHLYIDI
jgi:hypothetical protein